ncbi:hypothetical protein [Sulfitobacter sp. 20_GPM-1509m]|uniref:hypothetical protein n=1 Tax=Sulfitobacter sp. 20_GPM-1509m TaxID=1380367 RepID=UPI00048A50F4|nr:hypothetical protein [Sulfitobacter sp. 20_GPM-1509m]
MRINRQLFVIFSVFSLTQPALAVEGNIGALPQLSELAGEQVQSEETLEQEEDYFVLKISVPDFLDLLARDGSLRLDVTQRVRGTITDMRLTGTVNMILDRVCDVYALDWFAFNGVIHISARSEAMTRLIRLGDLDSESAIEVLQEAGLALEHYPIRTTAERSTIAMSGPPRMLALAEAVIESIPDRSVDIPVPRSAKRSIIVRRGTEIEHVATPVGE